MPTSNITLQKQSNRLKAAEHGERESYPLVDNVNMELAKLTDNKVVLKTLTAKCCKKHHQKQNDNQCHDETFLSWWSHSRAISADYHCHQLNKLSTA